MIRILIVDDHAILRAGLKHILAECSNIVVGGEAGNGLDALAKVRAEQWDAVVLDMTMPGKSGIELIRQIKSERPKLPILVLSMHKEDIYAVRTLKAGASGYLCKDNAEPQLEQAIRKVAGGGLFINPAVAETLAVGMLARTSEAPPHTRLSDREYQIFQYIVDGKGITEVSHELNLSVKTVSSYKTRVLDKMGMTNTAELIRYAVRHGLVVAGDDLAE
ncbi:MAG: response regulator transcription factor [Rhodocyclaceae bacterium]|nr:response regulator transcription factor [Rhodocyclaceae bacterium]